MSDTRVRVGGAVQYVADLPAGGNDVGDRRIVLEPPAGAESTTYRWDGAAWVPENEPLSGTLRLYVDGTNGDDTAQGTSWAEAWKTFAKLESELGLLLAPNPTDLTTIVYIRGAFTENLALNLNLSGSSRAHIVHHLDDFDTIRTGTIAAVGGEAPAPKHGLERLTLAGAALDGTEVGMTGVLIDPVGGSRATFTVIRVDVGNQYIWTTQKIGEFPAWVAASPADITIRRPSMSSTGCIDILFNDVPSDDAAVSFYPCSSVIGLRCDQDIYVAGNSVVAAGCYARSSGGTWKPLRLAGRGAAAPLTAYYYRYSNYYLSDTLATEFGLINGPTPTTYNVLGCAGGDIRVMSGSRVGFAGYAYGGIDNSYCSDCLPIRFSASHSYNALGSTVLTNFICRAGSTSYGGIYSHSGTVKVRYFSFLDLPATGASSLFGVGRQGAVIDVTDASFEGNNTGSGADRKLAYSAGGQITFVGGIPDGCKAKHRQLVVVEDGSIILRGNYVIPALEGGGPDIEVGPNGTIHFAGAVTKSATNPSGGGTAQPVLKVRRGGKVTMDATKAFTLPAGSGNNATDYGANGAIDIETCCDVALGLLAGGNAIATSTAVRVKKASRLAHAGAAPTWGAAALDQGGNAATWMPAAVTNDMAAGVPEDCWVLPGSA